jgi:hypothetical protein
MLMQKLLWPTLEPTIKPQTVLSLCTTCNSTDIHSDIGYSGGYNLALQQNRDIKNYITSHPANNIQAEYQQSCKLIT